VEQSGQPQPKQPGLPVTALTSQSLGLGLIFTDWRKAPAILT